MPTLTFSRLAVAPELVLSNFAKTVALKLTPIIIDPF